jgi:hypothetical protein
LCLWKWARETVFFKEQFSADSFVLLDSTIIWNSLCDGQYHVAPCVCVCLCVNVYLCVCIYVCACMCECLYVCVDVCMYVYLYVRMCVNVCINVCSFCTNLQQALVT